MRKSLNGQKGLPVSHSPPETHTVGYTGSVMWKTGGKSNIYGARIWPGIRMHGFT